MFVYYINVPLNKNGIEEFEHCEEEMPNVKTFELTKEEYEVLRQPKSLFQRFDEKFGIIIDICEEERIDNDNLSDALKIVNTMLAKHKSEVADKALRKVADSIKEAWNV